MAICRNYRYQRLINGAEIGQRSLTGVATRPNGKSRPKWPAPVFKQLFELLDKFKNPYMNIYIKPIELEEISMAISQLNPLSVQHILIAGPNCNGPELFEEFLKLRIDDYLEGQEDMKRDPTEDNKRGVCSALDFLIETAIIYRIIQEREREAKSTAP